MPSLPYLEIKKKNFSSFLRGSSPSFVHMRVDNDLQMSC